MVGDCEWKNNKLFLFQMHIMLQLQTLLKQCKCFWVFAIKIIPTNNINVSIIVVIQRREREGRGHTLFCDVSV
jgi:hypothetical protein